MLSSIIAERYARALLAAAEHYDQIELASQEAFALSSAIDSDKELRLYLAQPLTQAAEKTRVFSQALSGQCSKVFMQFLKVVFENKREAFLPAMLKQFQVFVNEKQAKLKAEISTPSRLSPKELGLIGAELSKQMDKEVALLPVVD